MMNLSLINYSIINSLNNNKQFSGWPPINNRNIIIGLFMLFFELLAITGNLLVICAVLRTRYLRSITNYFIVSLATADLLMGCLVMPFALVQEMGQGYWPFGRNWCDLWHALDVLCSTASILNLCAIAIERYWATQDPISYPRRMTKRRCLWMITGVWLCSSLISFPAIVWWRLETLPKPTKELVSFNQTIIAAIMDNVTIENVCHFTQNPTYLLLSSVISFYAPLLVMLVLYYRIYRTASNLIRNLNAGTKVIYKNGRNGEAVVLRIHRGGGSRQLSKASSDSPHRYSTTSLGNYVPMTVVDPVCTKCQEKHQNSLHNGCVASTSSNPSKHQSIHYHPLSTLADSPNHSHRNKAVDLAESDLDVDEMTETSPANHISRKLRIFAVGKRLTKFAREQKAAKTLGIVMGIFIICWLPFFVCNVVVALDNKALGNIQGHVMFVVTWLGYINSSINPLVYAHSMRDFRRAFIRLLCGRCSCCFHWLQETTGSSMSSSSSTNRIGLRRLASKQIR